jgi:hypothetical protein
MVVEVKAFESDIGSDSESEPERGRQIIDTEPIATIATTNLHPGERMSQMKVSAFFIHRCG